MGIVSKHFNEAEIDILRQVAVLVDEFFYEERKNIPQNKYVINVLNDSQYIDDEGEVQQVPDYLWGHWIMEHACDLSRTNYVDSFDDYWAKAACKKVIKYEWVIDETQ